MKRTQVYFDEVDYQLIEALAMQGGVKKAQMVRLVVKEGIKVLEQKRKKSLADTFDALLKIRARGPRDLSENLNEYVYGKYSQYGDKAAKRSSR